MGKQSVAEAKLRAELDALQARLNDLEHDEQLPPHDAVAMKATAVAHEVNNHMSAILGVVGLVRNEFDDDHPMADLMATIERAAIKSGRSMVELVEFAHGVGREHEPVNVNPIACHVLLSEEQRLAPSVRIVRNIAPDLWRVDGDYTEITRALHDLGQLAVSAIREEGRVTLTTRNIEIGGEFHHLGSALRQGKYVYLSVEDTGDSIPAELAENAFDPDVQEHRDKRELTLARVHAIVKRHRGHIAAAAREGGGNVFEIYLPAYEHAIDLAPISINDMPRGHETILVIDDDAMLRDVTKETLDRLGYFTMTASNGREAVNLVENYDGDIDLALLDLAMPVMGGSEAFPLLKRARPSMKIVICTGLKRDGREADALHDAGVTALLLKPYRPSTLARTTREALDSAPKLELGVDATE